MKRMSLLVALALLAGCTGQPNQPSPIPVPALGKDTGSTQQSQLSDDRTVNPHPDTDGINHDQSSKCGEQQEVIQQNLRIAAQAKLPVHTLDVWSRSESAIGTEQFKRRHSIEPTTDAVQKQAEQGQWTFVGKPGIVALIVPTPREQQGVGAEFEQYAFDPGSLTTDSPVKELATRFQSILAAGKVVASTLGMVASDSGPDKYTVGWGSVDPNGLVSGGGHGCSIQSVRTYQNERFGWVEIPMIDLNNAAYLGFAQDRVVTYSIKSGTFDTKWYTVSGIKPLK